MRKKLLLVSIVVALLALTGTVMAAPGSNFNKHLTGHHEVPARETLAQGQVNFKLSKNGSSLDYKLIVANIENVTAAHIHCGAAGANGPIGVTLFTGGVPGSGPVNGTLAEGTITAPDAGNSCGWLTLNDVLAAVQSGNTYVNVHTNDGVAPPNTGPGDFPGGEIRGQLD